MRALIIHRLIRNFFKLLSIALPIVILSYIFFSGKDDIEITRTDDSPNSALKKTEERGYDVVLKNPEFKGVNKDNEPYTILARKATKTPDQSYRFDTIRADFLSAGSKFFVDSFHGILDEENKLLHLNDGVHIYFSDFVLITDDLVIDLYKKNSFSDSTSRVEFKNSDIVSDSFRSYDQGRVIEFEGHVKSHINFSDF